MDFIKADEEMPIESGMVSKSIENAQKKVEAHHFDMRKHVLQYDDVLNTQREVIYRERKRILERADLKSNLTDMLEEHMDLVLATHIDPDSPPEVWEDAGLPEVLNTLVADIPLLSDIAIKELHGLSYDDLRTKIWEAIGMAYDVREQHLGSEMMRDLERQILLRTIDGKWIDYLHNIDILREGIHLRGYGQRDPLQEYKKEAFEMFNSLLRSIQHESIQLLFRAQPMQDMEQQQNQIELPAELFNGELDDLTDEQLNQFGLTRDMLAHIREAMRQAAEAQEQGQGQDQDPDAPVVHDGGVHFTASMPMMSMNPLPAPTTSDTNESDASQAPTNGNESGAVSKNGDSASAEKRAKPAKRLRAVRVLLTEPASLQLTCPR